MSGEENSFFNKISAFHILKIALLPFFVRLQIGCKRGCYSRSAIPCTSGGSFTAKNRFSSSSNEGIKFIVDPEIEECRNSYVLGILRNGSKFFRKPERRICRNSYKEINFLKWLFESTTHRDGLKYKWRFASYKRGRKSSFFLVSSLYDFV
ncbi:hypothetical protein CH380_01730 [Leptospira adleri]|uniref:Uncharacterized protein n=1 Tax=Leptospira adleri TaxID=2023186 RepID=A0A2M9YUS5_9LEPT|nr:hypothetical protein CH380_01730 [Leptospira adleri]PJZ60293.1 hypothetical protein CH376_19275 [Leptospira adleri]